MIPSHDIMVCVVVLISYIVVRYETYVSIIILIQQNFIICGPQVTFVIVIEQWWYIISAIMDNINAMSHYHCLSLIIQWFQAIVMNQTRNLFFDIFFKIFFLPRIKKRCMICVCGNYSHTALIPRGDLKSKINNNNPLLYIFLKFTFCKSLSIKSGTYGFNILCAYNFSFFVSMPKNVK